MSAVRVLAFAVIRRGGKLLVGNGVDEVKGERFHRLPGGEIEFGERGEDAVRRELLPLYPDGALELVRIP